MSRDALPKEVLRFLETYIDSIEQLSVLLLLLSRPDHAWTVPEITKYLSSTDSSIENRLAGLYEKKVLIRANPKSNEHKFRPANSEMEATIRTLAAENRARPYKIIDVIYARPNEALKAFADAFKIRGPKK